MILFLDFDGVLHPEGEGQLPNDGTDFCFLPCLEALLRDFPQVGIVISSTWRERLSLDELRSFFSPDIGARIIGATPPPRRDQAGYVHARREGEICAWLEDWTMTIGSEVQGETVHYFADVYRDDARICRVAVWFWLKPQLYVLG